MSTKLERKNIEDMSEHELKIYEHAIQIMKDRPASENNYTYHADLHNFFTTNPPHGCEHHNDLFFPWHRYHLFNFERELRATDPDHPDLSTRELTIPFWDWTQPPKDGKRYPSAFEREDSVLFDPFRETAPSRPIYPADYITAIIRDNPDWNKFAGGPKGVQEYFGAFESPAHNDMHSQYIQGDMGNPNTAAEDPIYWSFHCFIDRLWSRWQKIHGGVPTSPELVLRGFRGEPNAGSVTDTDTLGYFYNFMPEEVAPLLETLSFAEVIVERGLRPTMTQVAPLSETELRKIEHRISGVHASFFRLEAPRDDFQTAEIWLIGLKTPTTLSYQMEAFLFPEGEVFDNSCSGFREEYLAGDLSFWKAHRGPNGEVHSHRVGAFMPIYKTLQRLMKRYPNRPYVLGLTAHELPVRDGRIAAGKPLPLYEEVSFGAVVLALNGAVPAETSGGHAHDDHGHGDHEH